jgi:hypothetical protein
MTLRPAESELTFREILTAASDTTLSVTQRKAETARIARAFRERARLEPPPIGPITLKRVRELLKSYIDSPALGGGETAALMEAYDLLASEP